MNALNLNQQRTKQNENRKPRKTTTVMIFKKRLPKYTKIQQLSNSHLGLNNNTPQFWQLFSDNGLKLQPTLLSPCQSREGKRPTEAVNDKLENKNTKELAENQTDY